MRVKVFHCPTARAFVPASPGLYVAYKNNVVFVNDETTVLRLNVHPEAPISCVGSLFAYQTPKKDVTLYDVGAKKERFRIAWPNVVSALCVSGTGILFSDFNGTWEANGRDGRDGRDALKIGDERYSFMWASRETYAASGRTIYKLPERTVAFEVDDDVDSFQVTRPSEVLWTSRGTARLTRLLGASRTSCTDEVGIGDRGLACIVDSMLFVLQDGFVEKRILRVAHSIETIACSAATTATCRISVWEECAYLADGLGIRRRLLCRDGTTETTETTEATWQKRVAVRNLEVDACGYMYYTKKGVRGSLFRSIGYTDEETIATNLGVVKAFAVAEPFVFICCVGSSGSSGSSGSYRSTSVCSVVRRNVYDKEDRVSIDIPFDVRSACVDEQSHVLYLASQSTVRVYSFVLQEMRVIEVGNVHRITFSGGRLWACTDDGIVSKGVTILSCPGIKEVQVVGSSLYFHDGSTLFGSTYLEEVRKHKLVVSDVSPIGAELSWPEVPGLVAGVQLKKKVDKHFRLARKNVTSPYGLHGLKPGTTYDLRIVWSRDGSLFDVTDEDCRASCTTPPATRENREAMYASIRRKNRSGDTVFDFTHVDRESLAIVKDTIDQVCKTGDRLKIRFRGPSGVVNGDVHYVSNGTKFRLPKTSHNALLSFQPGRGHQKVRLVADSEVDVTYSESQNRILVRGKSYGVGDHFFLHGRRVTVAQGSIVLMFSNVTPDEFPYESTALGTMGTVSTGTTVLKNLTTVVERVSGDRTTSSQSSYVSSLEIARITRYANETLDQGAFAIGVLTTSSTEDQVLTDAVTCTAAGTSFVQNTVESSEDVSNVVTIDTNGISASNEAFAVYFGSEQQFRIKYSDDTYPRLTIDYLQNGAYVTCTEIPAT